MKFLWLGVFSFFLLQQGNAETLSERTLTTSAHSEDEMITTRIRDAVSNDPSLKNSELNIETVQGKVQFSGYIDTLDDMNKVLEIARTIPGVNR